MCEHRHPGHPSSIEAGHPHWLTLWSSQSCHPRKPINSRRQTGSSSVSLRRSTYSLRRSLKIEAEELYEESLRRGLKTAKQLRPAISGVKEEKRSLTEKKQSEATSNKKLSATEGSQPLTGTKRPATNPKERHRWLRAVDPSPKKTPELRAVGERPFRRPYSR